MNFYVFVISLCLVLVIFGQNSNILAYVDIYNKYALTGIIYTSSLHGLSIKYDQIATLPKNQSAMNSTLFQGFIRNSIYYGSRKSAFTVNLKCQYPIGHKYDCSFLSANNFNTTCISSITDSMTELTQFMKNVASSAEYQFIMGYDMQNANFKNDNYKQYFESVMNSFYSNFGSFIFSNKIELVQNGELFDSLDIIKNYNSTIFFEDMKSIYSMNLWHRYMGPGVSQNADKSWLQVFYSLNSLQDFTFTIKCAIFKNQSSVTLQKVMDEENYKNYLISRLTYDTGRIQPSNNYKVQITEMKMTSGLGIPGITNGFISALWAIDISLQFRLLGGNGMRFAVDLDPNNLHSVLGPAPNYAPNPIYYGLLMLSLLPYISPEIILPTVKSGSSLKIKSYGFAITNQLQVLILNKDIRENASGVVVLQANTVDRMQCLYLTAPNLTSTTDVKFAGYSFKDGNFTPQGNYQPVYYENINGSYYINLNYSQAVLCYLGNPTTKFPSSSECQNSQVFIKLLSILIIFFLII